jgi:glycosyltransferase involved in cell wall biosynthesis
MRNISIVIPVYNEAERIAACLESIAAQTVTPLEVIVVDNNSTDATVSIARSFPFVRVITAKCQGVIHARNRGFNAARGEIIGRIDADTRLHLAEAGHMVEFREDLTASISARCLDDTVSDFWSYALLSPGTYAQHNIRSGRYMYPIVILILLFHLPLRTLYRNSNIAQFTEYRRVNPATFVD